MDPAAGRVLGVAVGTVFVVAGVSKMIFPHSTFQALTAVFDFAPARLLGGLIALLAIVECVLGALLFAGVERAVVTWLAVALVGLFTLFLQRLRRLGYSSSCGCFGHFDESSSLEIGRNVVLIGALGVLAALERTGNDLPELAEIVLGLLLVGILTGAYYASSIVMEATESS